MDRITLVNEIFRKKTFLCIGLDPEPGKIPDHLTGFSDPILEFNKQIIDATRDLCVAYKPNLAFYEALGPQGFETFSKTVAYIGKEHFIIADAKRGDIGNTSRLYAKAFFEQLNCDAITIAPYMGEDSVTPFLDFDQKWVIVLALTSNKGSENFQMLPVSVQEQPLWEMILQTVKTWGTEQNTMFVIGATHPEAFAKVREVVPDHFLLVPGVGAQGGDLNAICQFGMNKDCGLLVNSSRGIIYASKGNDFAEKAREKALELQTQMAQILLQLNRR
ncbi:MAG: orotidine-5'-phosphate decarboxylase [Saprospiraceae bacterium]